MTHNELLDKIYWHWRKDNRGDGLQPMIDYRQALLAVVELHKPLNSLWHKQTICESCQEGNDYPITYPCETIQAIEKELK